MTSVEKPQHFPQGGRREKRSELVSRASPGKQNGQIRPVPGKRDPRSVLAEEQNPGLALAPEDLAHPSLLTTIRTLLGHNGKSTSSKRKIGRSLFGG
jgi:hypothetical protein